MEKSFKNKNVLVLVFEVLIIALGLGGITYATQKLINSRTSTIIKTGEYNIDYVGEQSVAFDGLEPIDDSLININTTDKVMRVDFSLRGVKTNKSDTELIYDVMLNEINADCSLLNKYTKWNLYKNGQLLSSGSLDPAWDGDVLNDEMRLTNIQETLPEYNQEYDKYTFILWISEACSDIENCPLVDQSDTLDSSIGMKIFIALSSGEKVEYTRIPSNNYTCANKPELFDKMLPLTYTNGNWVVADVNDNSWYDYSTGKWANAVIVKDNSKYQVGTVIDNNDVLDYYVWIPRYKYKLWNVEEETTDSYNAYDNGISIVFERGIPTRDSATLENDRYMTHPAFGSNLKGIWVNKYEVSSRGKTIDEYKALADGMSGIYNLSDIVNTHMISNLEWGAVVYLSHSKYGVCMHDGCDKIDSNNSYVAGANKQDTTTRNIYGIYDMAGGSGEYALGSEAVGTSTKEVLLENSDSWYNGHGLYTGGEVLIRGGLNRGLFYFGDPGMDPVENATRIVLTSK